MSVLQRRLALLLLLATTAGAPAAVAAQSPPRTPGVSGMPLGVPLLCSEPTVTSLSAGAWSDPRTWSTSAVPGADDRVAVAAGHDVTYDVVSDAPLACVEVQGRLAFSASGNTCLKVGTVIVLEGGRLEIGSPAAPVAAGVTAELIITDRPIDPAVDPDQVGNGLVALGAVIMHGAVKTPTFLRLGRAPRAGDTTIELAGPVAGWEAGDRVVIPDTRQLRPGGAGRRGRSQTETVRIASVAGAEVTLAAPLRHDHAGARDGGGARAFLPHVGNLSRNVIVRSENPRGTRGHTMFISRAEVDLRYAAFVGLGRTRNGGVDSTRLDTRGRARRIGTNQLGRYAVHFHHAFGPRTPPANGYQFTLVGNVVDGAPKWGITIHRSHHGLIRDNVVYNTQGAGIATEDGSESFNVFDHNFSVRSAGRSASALGAGYGGSLPGIGIEGAGFWFRGPNNYIRNNVAADARTYGFGLPAELGSVRVPAFQGADTSQPGKGMLTDMTNGAVLEFASNEAYGAMETGLETIWNGTVSGLTVWHPSLHRRSTGIPPERLVLDGLTVRGDLAALGETAEAPVGVSIANYLSRHVTVANADVQGMRVGVLSPFFYNQTPEPGRGPGALVVEDGYFRNHVDVSIATAYAAGAAGRRRRSSGPRCAAPYSSPSACGRPIAWPRESISANYETRAGRRAAARSHLRLRLQRSGGQRLQRSTTRTRRRRLRPRVTRCGRKSAAGSAGSGSAP